MRMGFRTQIALLVISVLFVAQVVSLWLFVDERSLAVQAAIGSEAAGRAICVRKPNRIRLRTPHRNSGSSHRYEPSR